MMNQGRNGTVKANGTVLIPTFFLILSFSLVQDAGSGPAYYLNELKTAVIGKTEEEVRSLLGSPNKLKPTQNEEKGSWEYGYTDKFTWGMHWNVIDEASGTHCWVVDVDFENGRAVTVFASNCKE